MISILKHRISWAFSLLIFPFVLSFKEEYPLVQKLAGAMLLRRLFVCFYSPSLGKDTTRSQRCLCISIENLTPSHCGTFLWRHKTRLITEMDTDDVTDIFVHSFSKQLYEFHSDTFLTRRQYSMKSKFTVHLDYFTKMNSMCMLCLVVNVVSLWRNSCPWKSHF